MMLVQLWVAVLNSFPLLDLWRIVGLMCVCLGFINGDLLPYGHVMFVHDVALIFCQCGGYIDEYCVIILILDYVLVYLVVFILMEPYGCTDFEFAFCVFGLVCLTRIG